MAHIHDLRRQIEETAELIVGYTGISHDNRFLLCNEQGQLWAERFMMNTQMGRILAGMPEYWSFWELEWQRVEAMFLSMIHYDMDRNEYYIKDIETGIRAWSPDMILALYVEFMDQKMNECQGNQVLMDMSFKRRVKNGRKTN